MKKLVTITLSVEVDGEDFHVHDDTQTHGNAWADVYRGMLILRDELQRQIDERAGCPYHPKNIKANGEPNFDAGPTS
jgi:hypothetical protein